jgi:PTH1 family peptidyl-tRNA hydrolase
VWLIAGLGNPGPKYAANRHNIGFMVVDELARRARAEAWKSKFGGDVSLCELAGQRTVLLKPMEYMNVSGRAVQRVAAFYQVEPRAIVAVHDEIDLELGRLQVKIGGGHAGHNGVRSIAQDLGTSDFIRLRVGVGRPASARGHVVGHVLGDFGKSEQEEAKILVQEAADAVEVVMRVGPQLAMNKVNIRKSAEA